LDEQPQKRQVYLLDENSLSYFEIVA